MPSISFVIPIYGVEGYLERCVESVLGQARGDLEAILVDDGSPDGCGTIADEYAMLDARVAVVHQTNRWLGGARNMGLKLAVGVYVAFVDSDDYISLDYSETVLRALEEMPVDMLFFNINHVDEMGGLTQVGTQPFESGKVYEGEDVQEQLYPIVISSHRINSAWMKVYKRAFLIESSIFFDESIRYAEDYEFCLRLFPVLSSFAYVDAALYYYVENIDSIMHTIDSGIVDKVLRLYRAREKFLVENNLNNSQNRICSAGLLIKSIVSVLPRYLGNPKSDTLELIRKIQYMINNSGIREPISLIRMNELGFGLYGRAIVASMRQRAAIPLFFTYVIGFHTGSAF